MQKQYKCMFRVKGSMEHQFPKWDVTGKEIQLLRGIHGRKDVVAMIKQTGQVEREDMEEYRRLAQNFSKEVVEGFFKIRIEEDIVDDVSESWDELEDLPAPVAAPTKHKVDPKAARPRPVGAEVLTDPDMS
jgi:hypothetical protein